MYCADCTFWDKPCKITHFPRYGKGKCWKLKHFGVEAYGFSHLHFCVECRAGDRLCSSCGGISPLSGKCVFLGIPRCSVY